MRSPLAAAIALSLLLVRVASAAAPVATPIGAWTRWAYPDYEHSTPRFFTLLGARFGQPPAPIDDLPFRYSVAVLVGVQQYDDHNLPPFEFVDADVEKLRSYLLGDGGFDVVYVLRPEVASSTAVDALLKNELPNTLDSRDRLLFYFSGHGANAGSGTKTGYMAFPKVKTGDWVTDLLAVTAIRDQWSGMLQARHALFVLDSCSAGFGLSEKDAPLGSAQSIAEALSGHGSRILITAGADAQRAVELSGEGIGGSLFTAIFLKAIAGGYAAAGPSDPVLITEEIFGSVRKETTVKAAALQRALTPHIEHFADLLYDGTFLFLNPRSKGTDVDADLAVRLGFPGAGKAPGVATPAKVDMVVGLGAQHRGGGRLTLDLGAVGGPVSHKLTLEVRASAPVPLQLEVDGEGLDASFTGGVWSTTGTPGKLVELDVTIRPDRVTGDGPRLKIRGGERLLADILVKSRLEEPEIVREAHSGPKDSGERKSFSPPYRLCLGPPPAGYALVPGSDEFSLSGDRRCGAWSTCEPARREASDVCWEFTLQGHDELIFDSGVRQSEGHLRGHYRLRASEPELRPGA
jgi:hypothetical protein